MKPFRILALSTVLFISVLSACASPEPEETSQGGPKANIAEPTNIPAQPTPEISIVEPTLADKTSVVPRELAEKAKADLAEYLNIDTQEIRVVESRAVEWPDTSLGCPQPEMAYTQVLTPGYWIVLEAKGQRYPYHTDQAEQIVLCLGSSSDAESGAPLPLIPVNPDEIKDGQPWVPVN